MKENSLDIDLALHLINIFQFCRHRCHLQTFVIMCVIAFLLIVWATPAPDFAFNLLNDFTQSIHIVNNSFWRYFELEYWLEKLNIDGNLANDFFVNIQYTIHTSHYNSRNITFTKWSYFGFVLLLTVFVAREIWNFHGSLDLTFSTLITHWNCTTFQDTIQCTISFFYR